MGNIYNKGTGRWYRATNQGTTDKRAEAFEYSREEYYDIVMKIKQFNLPTQLMFVPKMEEIPFKKQ